MLVNKQGSPVQIKESATKAKRTIILSCSLLVTVVLLGGCAASQSNPSDTEGTPASMQALVVGNGSGLVSEPYVFLAEERGLFSDEGLTVENVPGGSSAERVSALVGGSVDVTSMSISDLFLAMANSNFEGVIVAGGYGVSAEQIEASIPAPAYDGTLILETALILGPDVDITSLGSLKSVRMGVRSPSALTTLGLQVFIEGEFSNPPMLELIPFENQIDSLAALMSGDVQGALLSGAVAHEALTQGTSLASYPLAYWVEPGPFTLWVTTAETAEKKSRELNVFKEAMSSVAKELNKPESLEPFRAFLKTKYDLSDLALGQVTIPPLVEENLTFEDLAWISQRLLDAGLADRLVTSESLRFLQ
jgi:ABC-type phosphate/phosphonate transport system substrate-binding protein